MIPRWVVRAAGAVIAIVLFAVVARELPGLAILVAVVCGVSGLAYLVVRTREPGPLSQAEKDLDRRDVREDIPPNPG